MAGGVSSVALAFTPTGDVLDILFQNGQLEQFDSTGVHFLGQVV